MMKALGWLKCECDIVKDDNCLSEKQAKCKFKTYHIKRPLVNFVSLCKSLFSTSIDYSCFARFLDHLKECLWATMYSYIFSF